MITTLYYNMVTEACGAIMLYCIISYYHIFRRGGLHLALELEGDEGVAAALDLQRERAHARGGGLS